MKKGTMKKKRNWRKGQWSRKKSEKETTKKKGKIKWGQWRGKEIEKWDDEKSIEEEEKRKGKKNEDRYDELEREMKKWTMKKEQ